MTIRINHSSEAAAVYRGVQAAGAGVAQAMERLTSGLRINRAADDAGGLAVAEIMRSQIRSMGVASRNAADGVSLVQVADGAMGSAQDVLGRMRDLAVQAANGTLSDGQRAGLDTEFQGLMAELGRIGTDTEFNGVKVVSGSVASAASAVTLQVGPSAGQTVAFTIATVSASDLGVSGIAVSSQAAASAAIASIDAALSSLSGHRADMGAIHNRLERTISQLGVGAESLAAAESRIRDADMAQEATALARGLLLQSSGLAMLAQANASPRLVLSLLR